MGMTTAASIAPLALALATPILLVLALVAGLGGAAPIVALALVPAALTAKKES